MSDNVVRLRRDTSVDDALVRLHQQHAERELQWVIAIGVGADGMPVTVEGGEVELARAVGLLQVLGTALTMQTVCVDES